MPRPDKHISLRYPEDIRRQVDAYRKLVLQKTGDYPDTTNCIHMMIERAVKAELEAATNG